MPELDYSLMNDTLDNFSFADIKLQNLGPKTSDISFDDSHFVEDILFNFDISHCLNSILKPLEADDSQILVNSSTSSDEISPLKSSPIIEEKDESTPINSPNLNATSIIKSPHIKIVQPESEKLPAIIPITEQMCHLSSWSIPDPVLHKYKLKNVTKMFHWQCECLSNSRVLHELSNLIYSAPTSAGKTLVAEILALKTIFNRKKKTIFILPFVSIVKEKMYYFQDLLEGTGIRVEGYMGSYNPPGGFAAIQFAICTIEKANSLINRLLEEGSLADVGAVFVDEMHLLGDPHRGYLLELLLTKLRYISLKVESIKIQIIGMSATLPNLGELATWLGAELYSTSFRPIPLFEQVIVNGEIYDKDFQLLRKLEPLVDVEVDTDFILQLCLEVIRDSYSVLIFCPTKKWCESLAQQLSQAFFKIGNSQTTLGELLRTQIKSDLIMEVLEQLKLCPTGLDSILRKTVSFGIGFHHAGLTMDERDIIEGSFRNGAIKVLAATSTLSSGFSRLT
ncbi:DNA polymerase theta-like [Euwallacea similis]|uniref:DNA polymerase theta-like n=1 Tax=Euwallacea similis TaxID=1736056 RepID=UPI00344E46F1